MLTALTISEDMKSLNYISSKEKEEKADYNCLHNSVAIVYYTFVKGELPLFSSTAVRNSDCGMQWHTAYIQHFWGL